MDVKDILAALRGAWWLPVLGLLLGGAGALAWSLSSQPLYLAQTTFFVSTAGAETTAEALQGSHLSEQRIDSYARLLEGEELAGRVIDRLDLDVSPASLTEAITASPVEDTLFLDVRVLDPSPEQARDIAETIGAAFPELVTDLESPPGTTRSPVTVSVVATPEVPGEAFTPRTDRNVVVGAGLGFVAGALVALARARLDRSVRDPRRAAQLAGAPIMGTVLRDRRVRKRRVYDPVRRGSAESFRQLRNNLQHTDVGNPPRVVMVTSAELGEGKTTLVVNLAGAVAEAGRRVVIVDAHLRRPRVTDYLGLPAGGPGLAEVLNGSADLTHAVRPYRDGVISVLGAGAPVANPGQLLGSRAMLLLLERLAVDHDLVLVDAPPVLPVADATSLASMVDGVVLVVRFGETEGELLEEAAAALQRVRAKTLGVALTVVPPRAVTSRAFRYGRRYVPRQAVQSDTDAPGGTEGRNVSEIRIVS